MAVLSKRAPNIMLVCLSHLATHSSSNGMMWNRVLLKILSKFGIIKTPSTFPLTKIAMCIMITKVKKKRKKSLRNLKVPVQQSLKNKLGIES